MKSLLILVLVLALTSCNQFWQFYPSNAASTAFYTCVKQQNPSKLVVYIQSDPDGIDKVSLQNLINAKNAGLELQITVTPCRARSAFSEAQLILKEVGQFFNTIWVYPKDAEEACSWFQYPAEFNCMYLQQFVNEMKKNGKNVGIQGHRPYWTQSFQSDLGCTQVQNLKLLWVPYKAQNDLKPNFHSFHPLGGWTAPYAKQYNSKRICGDYIAEVYYE